MNPYLRRAKQFVGRMLAKIGIKRSNRLHTPTLHLATVAHGSTYGGWTLFPEPLSAKSVVYSFGIGEDASFDRDVMQRYGLSLHAFDPTPRSIQWVEAQTWPSQFAFHPYGLAAQDGTAQFYPPSDSQNVSYSVLAQENSSGAPITVPMLRLATIAKQLGHSHIDVLKMDIEGAEYEVIPDIVRAGGPTIQQILVEFHHFFPEVERATTKKAVQQLQAAGYEIFYVSPSGYEYSLIRR